MTRKKLTVHREGYWRKSHIRTLPSGRRRRVKRSWIPKTSYKTMDRGAPGRTPESEQWFEPEGSLYGWHKGQGDTTRHRALEISVREDGYATTIRRLNALRNVSTDRETDQKTKKDMEWLRKKYR